jgi:signal recognition particle GTPase
MDPKSVKEFPERHTDRKRKVDHIGKSLQENPTNVSSATLIKHGDGTSIWDNNFPFGDFIDNHLMTEKDHENLERYWQSDRCLQVMKAAPLRLVSIARFMELKVGNLEKKIKAYDEENSKLKMKLNESEKNIVKLKENVEELSLEKSQLMERQEELIEENSKLLMKKDIVEKLKAEIEELNSEIVKRDEISLQCSSTLLGTIRRLK